MVDQNISLKMAVMLVGGKKFLKVILENQLSEGMEPQRTLGKKKKNGQSTVVD